MCNTACCYCVLTQWAQHVAREILLFFNRNYRYSTDESWDIGYKNPGEHFKWLAKRATHFDDVMIKIT